MRRLDAFDLLFTDWMLGFSVLLLVAIKFAPGIVGQQLIPRSIVMPKTFLIRQHEGNSVGEVNAWEEREYCPLDNSRLDASHTCPVCGVTYPAQLVTTFSQNLLYILLILFVVKYLHERSVLRFRLYEDERLFKFQEKAHRFDLGTLHERSNRSPWHFLTFVSRVLFLGFFYLFVITIYIHNHGTFGGGSNYFYGFLLVFGYVIPDAGLFSSTKGQAFVEAKSWLRQRAPWILGGSLLGVILISVLAHFFRWDNLVISLLLLGMVSLLSLLLIWRVSTIFDQCSIEVTALKWLLLDIFNMVAIVEFLLASLIWRIDPTWIASAVLLVNLLDWFFSKGFYFGTDKFTIKGNRKEAYVHL